MILREKKNFIINVIKLLITFFVFYFIFKKLPGQKLFLNLVSLNIKFLILAVLSGFLFTFFKILKWHFLLKDLIRENSLSKSIDSYFIGMSIGLITPGRLGEVARVGNINKEKRVEGLSLVILDKIFDLLVVLILAFWGFSFFFGIHISIILGILIILSIILIFNQRILEKFSQIYPFKKFPRLIEGILNLKRRTLLLNFILSFLSYFLVLIEVYLLVNSFEKFSFFPTFICYPIVMLVNLFPITIGGLGIREGTAIFLLGKFSLSPATAFNSAFLLFLINTALPAIIGVAILNKNLKDSKIIIFIVTLLGALLRIYKISERSIWLDEAITAQVSQMGITGIILNRSQTGIHPPFYFIIMYFWIKLLGDSEFTLRSLSFIFGTLSILLLYKFVNKIYDKTTALISSLLFSLSPFLIYFSQEARMYPLFTFLALLSLNFIYDLINKEFNRKNLIKILMVNSLLLYTHFFSSLLILAENIFIFITQRKNFKNLKNWIISQLINLIIFSPWIYVIFTRNTPEVYQGAQKLSIFTILVSLYQIFLGFTRIIIDKWNLSNFLLLFFLILSFVGILPPYKEKKGFLLNILYFFIPFFSLIAISLFGKSFYSSRYLSAFVPGLLILLSRGIKKLKFPPLIILLILFLIGLYSILDLSYYSHMKTLNRPWRDIVSFIHENSDSSHKVLITESYYYRPFEYYNRGKLFYIPVNPDFFSDEKLRKELSNTKRFWLVLSDHNDRTLKVKNWLDNNFKNKEIFKFYKAYIYLYEN